ncbi:MAG: nucleoside phosphorylase [Verrucomicrobiales bacterium]|nr:nucleoside phosphorylase [Verrucomicrobiales bacterium]
MIPQSPLLQNKHFARPAVFQPENLLRETRRQKSLPAGDVPKVCILDPDGDIVGHLLKSHQAERDRVWACYHTSLYRFERAGYSLGIIGCAVGGPFAVLLAEQLFVSGCELLLSVTSAGQIAPVRTPPYFVLIQKALRDEGTSHHYLPPTKYVSLLPEVDGPLLTALSQFTPAVERGAAWTTDAPYRETEEAIKFARTEGVLAVEMEAASLYAFAQARRKPVVCFAHITNRMGVSEGDFEKGEADGTVSSLRLIEVVAQSWCRRASQPFIHNPTPTV